MSQVNRLPQIPFQKHRLANGLEVLLSEDHRLPLVALNIWYHVGPVNERPGLTGFAHLFEHMMFEGSRHVGEKAHFRFLEAAGASEINGTTDFDRTNYFETLPSNQLELALWLESDRMGFLLDKLDEENLENQRDVVRNERRQSVENAPYGLVQEEVLHLLFPKGHPYHASVIGSHADIEAARLADVREFFQLYYAPNNASLAIVGNIEPERTLALVEKYFGSIPSGPPVPPVDIVTPPIHSERRTVVGDRVELPRVYLSWITDPIFSPGDAECDLIARILGGGKSSRLYKSLVYEKRIAQDVHAMQYSLALGSVFTVVATAKPGVLPEDLERHIDEEIQAFQSQGPTPQEIEAARNAIEAGIIRALESLGGFGGVADRLNQYNHFLQDPGRLAADIERYRRADVASVQDVARSRLTRAQRAVVHGVPGEKKIDDVPRTERSAGAITSPEFRPAPSQQEWRREIPAPAPPAPIMLPVPRRWVLDNGLTVLLVEQHNLPVVAANLIALCGSERNPIEKSGLASFTASMLDEGTIRRGALDIAREAEALGAVLGAGSGADLSFLSLRTLKRTLEGAFELLADVLLNPAFSEKDLERVRHDRLTRILQQKDEPSAIAGCFFARALYGTSHPYGYPEIGTADSNRDISRNEIQTFWRSGFVPAGAALVLSGDITEAEVADLAARHLGCWTGKEAPRTPMPLPSSTGRRVIIIDKPASAQTTLRVGHIGVARSCRDYAALEVMNTILGGLFSSRINLNLRETHGYTYGAFSSFVYRRDPGPFMAGTSVRTDVTGAAVTEVLKEIGRMRSEDVTPEELSLAGDSISHSLPGLFETTPQIASSIGQLFTYDLGLDHYRILPEEISRVGAGDVRRVAENYLHPENLAIVAVGDASKIEGQLCALDLAPVEVYDVDGNPLSGRS